ncbi:MAG: hypothetical protein LPK45_02580 [Bacteroidota bacterium]|nr:hypothetical protein [Bacteroidota bacterium]MDX5429924.1 hypothetical protein [Bacteroidota bacterium]MDX5468698.1 hypothetical protein [Bacteroidota bacterium]
MHKLLFSILVAMSLAACSNSAKNEIKNGDMLFLIANEEGLSQAIDAVTENDSIRHYSHLGIVQISGIDTLVWHAAPEKGVCAESISDFRTDKEGKIREMHVYRMHDSMQKHLPVVWKRASILKGKPYNETYIMEDDGYYCSEFIYALFSTYNIFELKPMTFKDPTTGQTHPQWEEHYKKLGVQVPEGKPGCNPNGMAGSPYLERVK